jgi:hypothetical protein
MSEIELPKPGEITDYLMKAAERLGKEEAERAARGNLKAKSDDIPPSLCPAGEKFVLGPEKVGRPGREVEASPETRLMMGKCMPSP